MSEPAEAELVAELAPRPDPYLGKTLAGRYRVVRLLGGGGMGAVYEAEHTLIGRRVAVKLLHSQLAGDATVVKRFVNEARAAATIGHPNILDCTDIGQAEDGSPFLVLELLEGNDLEHEIQSKGPMPIGRLVRILRQAASALAAAHSKGIVHRDMKPENIFLSVHKGQPDHVKVLDFGISKFASLKTTGPGTMAGTAMGTPYYMAPEQFRDASSVDHRADIYALGIILYQGLAGRLPYLADNLPSLALEISQGTPPPLEKLRPDVSDELLAIVMKAMARDREDRFQSMAELFEALAPFSDHDEEPEIGEIDPALAGASGSMKISSAARTRIRRKDGAARAIPIALGVVLALGGASAWWFASKQSARSATPVPAAAPPVAAAAALAPVAPVAAPAPTPPPVQKVTLSIGSPVAGAIAVVRGRHVTLPYTQEIDPGAEPEAIEVVAPGRTALRFSLLLDESHSLWVDLPRGRDARDATPQEIAAAIAGQPGTPATAPTGHAPAAGSRSVATPPTSAPAAAAPAAPTAPPAETRPAPRNGESGVYRGPTGDLPSL